MNDGNEKRVVVLVDMDCFYCQVEVQHNKTLTDKPVAVVQYNSWRGGGIIAVNYEARAKGVKRYMRGDDAVQTCPDLNLVRVKELHGKADLSKYRTASQKVFEVLSEFSPCVQRASIDEAYVDLTNIVNDYISSNHNVITENDLPNTFVEGYMDQNSKENLNKGMKSWLHDVYHNELQDDYLLRLTVGAMLVEDLRKSIFEKTGFRCSAGIANNKILAKLACGLHKPNQQTLVPPSSIPHLFETIPIKKVKNLGGKLGVRVRQEFNCEFMSDLASIPLNNLRQKFDEKTCNFLYQVSKGIDNEPVESRLISKSIGSCKSFPLGLKMKDEVLHWLSALINDIVEKLDADYEINKRKATLMTVSVKYINKETNLPTSQCCEVTTYNNKKLLDTSFSLLCNITENKNALNWNHSLSFLGVSIGKFVETNVKSSIDNYFIKGITKEEKYINTQSSEAENGTSCSKNNIQSLSNVNTKKNETIGVKNIKTMFGRIKDASNYSLSSIEKIQNLDSTNEKPNKSNLNSFFSRKLEVISPVKNQVNNKLTTVVLSPSVSSINLPLKNLEMNSSSKSIQNDTVESITQSANSFFVKKLETVSPSKHQANQLPIIEDSVENIPTTLLCERCNKLIDIDHYDEHIDFHVAIELSKSINKTQIVQPTNNEKSKNETTKKNICSKKRKHLKSSNSNSKKSCLSISSYFKPVLNP